MGSLKASKKKGTIFLEQTIRLPFITKDLYMYPLYKSYGDNNPTTSQKKEEEE
jgi:hypothetical protein